MCAVTDRYGLGPWCRVGSHSTCPHRRGGRYEHGQLVPECMVTMPFPCPGRTDDFDWVPRFANGVDAALVSPAHVFRCPCECHQVAQLELFEVAS